jgi:hypothetical protein
VDLIELIRTFELKKSTGIFQRMGFKEIWSLYDNGVYDELGNAKDIDRFLNYSPNKNSWLVIDFSNVRGYLGVVSGGHRSVFQRHAESFWTAVRFISTQNHSLFHVNFNFFSSHFILLFRYSIVD